MDTFVLLTMTPKGGEEVAWWQVATGIIAIPVALVGLIGSWYLVRKTRLESRKLELEILEKEQALDQAKADQDPIRAAEIVAEPVFQTRRVQVLILRGILLVLVLDAWSLAQKLLVPIFRGIRLGAAAATANPDVFAENTPAEYVVFTLVLLLEQLPTIAYWWIFIALGWPLLSDTAHALSIELPAWVAKQRTRRILILVMVVLLLASAVLGLAASD
ncbi:hypothetical protein [Nonomuraea sp. JJY05]|uniref:hypothetical protein n=1 Tax=Nonomuraea sp. JJY05 TaxID=3350255 RepID=UPI00373F7540